MKKEDFSILDDRHEMFNRYSSQCAQCRHYNGDYSCVAFPDEIPESLLSGEQKHDFVIPSQQGNVIFTQK